MNPQAVTVGARMARRLNPILRLAIGKTPDRVSFCGGLLAALVGNVAGMIGPQAAAELLRIAIGRLEQQPQLELPPGVRLALAAAEQEEEREEPAGVAGPSPNDLHEAAQILHDEAILILESNCRGDRQEWADDTENERARYARYMGLASRLAPLPSDAAARALFEKNAEGWRIRKCWDDLGKDTKQFWRDEAAKRSPIGRLTSSSTGLVSRDDVLEEAARVCDKEVQRLTGNRHYGFQAVGDCAVLIRALKATSSHVGERTK